MKIEINLRSSHRGGEERKGEGNLLCVSVLFTDVPNTLVALGKAASLAAGLNARIELVAPVVVPYPLPVEQCPVARDHTARRLRTIAGGIKIPTQITVVYCRDKEEAVRRSLKTGSVLVVAWKKRWLFDQTARLVRKLRGDGYHVITIEKKEGA